jgi:pyridinium-3,5-biscarboxylic acid mononucleotide sulfurtransferase
MIAYSGGVDSTYLAYAAHQALGGNILCVTVHSPLVPRREADLAGRIAREEGWKHQSVHIDILQFPGVRDNPPDRCYHCKKKIFDVLCSLAKEEGIAEIIEGSNADDTADYRPGARAVTEANIKSPLLEAGLGKSEIRQLSHEAGLPNWQKPAQACLASRIPYGTRLTEENLQQVDEAEQILLEKGITQCRVRHHGEVARIEVPKAEIPQLTGELQDSIVSRFHALGFRHIAVDLEGYRTGSMNAALVPCQP